MANENNATIGFEKQIWDAACVLWGHIPAAEYRKVIVGLIFLRYMKICFSLAQAHPSGSSNGISSSMHFTLPSANFS